MALKKDKIKTIKELLSKDNNPVNLMAKVVTLIKTETLEALDLVYARAKKENIAFDVAYKLYLSKEAKNDLESTTNKLKQKNGIH